MIAVAVTPCRPHGGRVESFPHGCVPRGTEELRFPMKKNAWRAVIDTGFIVFLFYSNLLMGEFSHSGMGQKRGLAWAVGDIFTAANFVIAVIAALIGYILVEFLRSRF
jgi:hypothetical protein